MKNLLLAAVAAVGLLAASGAEAQTWTRSLPLVGPGQLYPYVQGYETLPADTQLPQGAQPQSVAPTAFQLAAIAAVARSNTASATSGAATLNTQLGDITSESLSTAAAAVYTLTLTNSVVSATSAVQAMAFLGTSTQGQPTITSIVPGAGSVVVKVTNTGARAFNGTIHVVFEANLLSANN